MFFSLGYSFLLLLLFLCHQLLEEWVVKFVTSKINCEKGKKVTQV